MKKSILLALCACAAMFCSMELNAAKVQASTTVQQPKGVSGVVSDKIGPLAGAGIMVKGTNNGVITDADGSFSLPGDRWQHVYPIR